MFNRARSALRYLTMAEPLHKWRPMRSAEPCVNCGTHQFFSLGGTAFLTRCLGCGANLVTLTVPQAIRDTCDTVGDAYELSSYGATFDWLKRNARSLAFSEFRPGKPLGAMVDGIRNEDVTRLTFADASFDIVTSNGVMEHVPDDCAGYAEIARVLRPGGRMYMTVPLYDTPATVHLASLTPAGVEWHGPEEYHDSRLGGPKSVVTFWRHSYADICERVRARGFSRVWLHEDSPVPGVRAQAVIVAER